MTLHFPWIELMLACPLVGAFLVRGLRNPDLARWRSLIVCSATLVCALGAWASYSLGDNVALHDAQRRGAFSPGEMGLAIDGLSAPLLPLVSLVYLLTVLATLRTKVRKLSFGLVLVTQAILLATLCSTEPWLIIALLAAGAAVPWIELRRNRKPTAMYTLHMSLFVGLLIAGQWLLGSVTSSGSRANIAAVLLVAACLVRSGIVPLHCWMTDLFEYLSFGSALLFVTPMVGAYAAARLVLPIAPEWLLHGVAIISLLTAFYAAGMALVQRDARRFFCFIFISHASLVFVGLATATPLGVTAALCMWLAVALSMAGFGLTLRSVEARTGRLSLDQFHGLYEHAPGLAALFLITGLASIGFPGTIGFIGAELLVDGAVQVYPLVGIAIVVAAALNGLAVLHAYFRVFTGTRNLATIDLGIRLPERIAVLVVTALVLGAGLYPQPNVASRYDVATQLVRQRQSRLGQWASPPQSDLFGRLPHAENAGPETH